MAKATVSENPSWTKLYFTERSPPRSLASDGHLTLRGLCAVLLDLSVEGNYGPICKKGGGLYSNSDRSVAGHYYLLTRADENLLLQAAAEGILEIQPKGDSDAYLDLTSDGLVYALRQPLDRIANILSETQSTFLKARSRDLRAVYNLIRGFETDLIRARSFNAPDFTFHNVVSILHKLMLDPQTAREHLRRGYLQEIRRQPIQNDSSLFDLYVGPKARVLNSYEQSMFMSVSNTRGNSDYRLGKWHGGYNHLGDYNPLHYGRRSLNRTEWLKFKVFEVYRDDYTIGGLLDLLRNNEVSHSSLSKRPSISRMLEIANRRLRDDGDSEGDGSRGVHETLVYIGYSIGKLLQIIRCWRIALRGDSRAETATIT